MTTPVMVNQNTGSDAYSQGSIWLIGVCFVFSGATGLIYEVLWARMLGLVFGATTLAVSTVLAAFMGGLALGSALAGRVGARISRPLKFYGFLELGIALYALAVPFLFSWVDNLYALIWQQLHPGAFVFSVWRFALSCMVLLLPTTLMGATLPILAAALLRSPSFKATSVTRLYTCNLAGAICGTVSAGFLLLPSLGVATTVYVAATINMIIGTVAILADRANEKTPPELMANRKFVVPPAHQSLESNDVSFWVKDQFEGRRFWLFCAFVSGFVTIGTQVAWTRILTMIIGSSTYAFSVVVAMFLVGLSAGAYIIGRRKYLGKLRRAVMKVELCTAISLLLSLVITNRAPGLLIDVGLWLKIDTWSGLLALQIFSAALILLLPAFLMGMTMPLVLAWASGSPAQHSVRLVGRSYAVNTIGAIAGACGAGFILIPSGSIRFTILIGAALCLLVAGLAYQPKQGVKDTDLRRSFAFGITSILILLLFVLAPPLKVANLSAGAYDSLVRILAKTNKVTGGESNTNGPEVHRVLMYEEGPTSTVSVRKDWQITSMAINGRTNASDDEDMPTQVMLGQLALLLAPKINNALVVGFASGVSVGAILQSPLESLECVELEPATIRGSRYFEHVNNQPLNDPRLHLIIDDARTYLRVTPNRYNIIASEPSHPWVPGVANLFTKDFFELGRDRLSDDGIFVQWLQMYQLSIESLRSVLATYNRVFPHVMIFRVGGIAKGKDLILVGSKMPLSLDHLAERMANDRIAGELARVGMNSEADVRSWYVCDEMSLGPAVAGAIINTDDNMHIETTVPREVFLPLMQANSQWVEALRGQRVASSK